jgi:lysophospholipase L1-like esterase
MRTGFFGPRWRRYRQHCFRFLERSRHRERWFKGLIALSTCLVIALIVGMSPWGRYGTAASAAWGREAVRQVLGLPRPRSEVDESWSRYRQLGIEESGRALVGVFAEADPHYQRLMRYAGLDPGHGLLRWGNYDLTLLLPSTVFEADDQGRSYRLKPRTRSIWLRSLTIKSGVLMFFLVPDGPGLAEAMRGTPAVPVETSRQMTNSWGLRGPEPDLDAPLRGIVLGDSFMQGMFIGDDETPPECLRRYLQGELKTRVSILNTGVMGYSPEQYYHSLMAFADKFRPDFVVVSFFTNDFGDLHKVPTQGIGDWEEGKYWLEKIVEYCRAHQWPHVIVPAPYQPSMFSKRRSGHYPGMISNILEVNGLMFLDPTDDFIDAHLEAVIADQRKGRRQSGCSLFNDAIGDGHFSAAGSEVWARSVGHRLVLLLEKARLMRELEAAEQASKGASR